MRWLHVKAANGRWMTHRGEFTQSAAYVRRSFRTACGREFKTIDSEGPGLSVAEVERHGCAACKAAA